MALFITFFGLHRILKEKDHPSSFQLGTFPFVSFYDFSKIGTILYEKVHYGLSLRSFRAFSSRKDYRANLVSFMLVKVFEWPSSQYRFNLFQHDWTTNGKEVSHPLWMSELSYVYFYPFSGIGDYQWKRAPTGVFFVLSDFLKLKAPLSIYFHRLAKNTWDRTTIVSLDTTP